MEGAIETAFSLIRPFLVAGILTVFCYRVVTAFMMADAKQGFRILTWGFAFAIGFTLVDVAVSIQTDGKQELISCSQLSHLSNCNGWILYGTSGKDLGDFITYLGSSGHFSMANASIIMSVAGLILTLELTKAVWQASAPPIVGAFFTGCLVYVVLTSPGYFLKLTSEFLAVGASTDYNNNVTNINEKISSLEALFDTSKALSSTRGVLQIVGEGFQAPIKYLIEILFKISMMLLTLINAIFLVMGALVLSWLPNLTLFSFLMGAFDRWTLPRWLGYISCLKVIVIVQVWVMGLLPNLKPAGNSLTELIGALSDVSSTVIGSLLIIVIVAGIIVMGSLKLLNIIWLREIMPAVRMSGVLKENFGSAPMDKYF